MTLYKKLLKINLKNKYKSKIMSELLNKKCVPCEGGLNKLSKEEAINLLKINNLDWVLNQNYSEIYKEFKFKNYVNAESFVIKVGIIAEQEGHHPDISFGWGYAKINIHTHAIGGLHENDFILAAKINLIELN
jgi:4a-hydroxytetrahydrobiopterin dehydratase